MPDFNKGAGKEAEGYLNFFRDLGWCEKGNGYLDSYERLLVTFCEVEESLEQILSDIINNTPGMRKFMIIHSVFSTKTMESKGDWFEKLMAKIVYPTEKDMIWFTTPPEAPDEIKNLMTLLNGELVRWEKCPIRIEFRMWGKRENNESYEPIHIIDEDFEKYDKEYISTKQIIHDKDVIEL